MTNTILLLGGNGKTGRRIAERLTAQGTDIRIGSRSAEIPFDWHDRSTWKAVVADISAVYITYFPDVGSPRAVEAVAAFAETAVGAGVRRLVLLSGRGAVEALKAEERLSAVAEAAGAEWTVVRASWFAQNFNEGFVFEPVVGGVVALPVGDMKEPFIDVEDVADVAVVALTEDGHHGEVYEVSGPRLLSFPEAVAEIGAATGRDISFVTVPMEAYAAVAAEAGLDEESIAALTYLFIEELDGRNAHLTDGVQRALGREPRDFADFAREAAATGVWNA